VWTALVVRDNVEPVVVDDGTEAGNAVRVLVTGGTGYLGSHIVGALRREGHDVRVLARSPERVAPALTPLGVDPADVEVAVGDVCDRASMDAAVDGADAMINAANVYSLDVRDAERMLHVNRTGTEVALTAAVEGGLSPIVHVSSYVALLPSTVPLTSASPTGEPEGAYLVSKAESERIAFRLRQQGAPVVVTNPGAVYGPYDPNRGESTRLLRDRLVGRAPLHPAGSLPTIDVRDLALAHARLIAHGPDQARFLTVGRRVPIAEEGEILRRATGRRLPALPVPRAALPLAGRLADGLQRRGLDLGFSSMSTYILQHEPPVDDRDTQEVLGVSWRPVEETLADMVAWMHTSGLLRRKHAGAAAGRVPAVT
jgi:dihydroflavonol-4-reductase